MSATDPFAALSPGHRLALMTECLSRAVDLCRPRLSADQANCLDQAVAIGWDAVAGRAPGAADRIQLHQRVERIAARNAPQRGGRLEVYHAANAATFVLGALANAANLGYASSLLHLVPNVLRALHPTGYQAAEAAEVAWQQAVLVALPIAPDPLPRAWFAEWSSCPAEPVAAPDRRGG